MTVPTPPPAVPDERWHGPAYVGAPETFVEAVADGRPLRVPRWGLVDVVVLMIGAFLVPFIGLSVALAAGMTSTSAVYLLLAATTPWVALAGWPLLTTRLQGNGPRIDLGFAFRRSDLGWGVLGGLAALLLGGLAALLSTAVFGEFSSAAGDIATESGAPRVVLVVFAVLVAFGAPVVEELAFRGLVYAAVAKRVARGTTSLRRVQWFAGSWTSVLFTLVHFEYKRVLVLLVIAAVLAFLRARTGRCGASVVAHAVNNLPGAVSIALIGI